MKAREETDLLMEDGFQALRTWSCSFFLQLCELCQDLAQQCGSTLCFSEASLNQVSGICNHRILTSIRPFLFKKQSEPDLPLSAGKEQLPEEANYENLPTVYHGQVPPCSEFSVFSAYVWWTNRAHLHMQEPNSISLPLGISGFGEHIYVHPVHNIHGFMNFHHTPSYSSLYLS